MFSIESTPMTTLSTNGFKTAKFKHNIKILTLTGGMPYKPQVHSLSHQAHIIVATPGRVLKHLEDGNFLTEDIDTLVLDEADRMLDMGFVKEIRKLHPLLPKKHQTLLFSATFSDKVRKLSKLILNKPAFKIFLFVNPIPPL